MQITTCTTRRSSSKCSYVSIDTCHTVSPLPYKIGVILEYPFPFPSIIVSSVFSSLPHKQQKGSTKSSGSKNGNASRLKPHVQKLMAAQKQRMMKMEKEMMKHPPRRRVWS